jgi:glycosyltransferase involved in cell wall biosynthesis
MKIILVNPRYFISGGPERYMFNLKEVLESKGHKVIPFSVKHNLNESSEYEPYFLDQIGTGNEVYFNEVRLTKFRDIRHSLGRLFYSVEAKRKLSKLIHDSRPDLIYILNFENKISPSIIDAAKKYKLPVVMRISDFAMICAANVFYLYKKREICERCLVKGKYNLVIHKCSHNSLLNSILKYFSYLLHDILKIDKKIDAFVIPSDFTKGKYIEYGIPESKIFRIPTFYNFKNKEHLIEYRDFALYVGRIDPDKGIKTLVDAFIDTDYKLKIIGFSMSDYEDTLIRYLSTKKHNISFLGKMSMNEIEPFLEKCRFCIVPSEWFDNFPNAILESFAFKKPVVATRVGSLTELVEDGKTGLVFNYKDSKDLLNKVEDLFADKSKARLMGENGYKKLKNEFSSENHVESLLKLFASL